MGAGGGKPIPGLTTFTLIGETDMRGIFRWMIKPEAFCRGPPAKLSARQSITRFATGPTLNPS